MQTKKKCCRGDEKIIRRMAISVRVCCGEQYMYRIERDSRSEGPRRRKPATLLHKRQEDLRRECVAGQQHVRVGEVLS